jgi:hypothetical protein
MTDTPPDVEARYQRMLLALSPEQRVRMACQMLASAKVLIRAGAAGTQGEALRREIFLRLYGDDFTGAQREAAIAAITGISRRSPRHG